MVGKVHTPRQMHFFFSHAVVARVHTLPQCASLILKIASLPSFEWPSE